MANHRIHGEATAGLISLSLEVLDTCVESEIALVDLIACGLPKTAIKILKDRTGLSNVEIAQVLQVKKRTLERWLSTAEDGALMTAFQSSQLWALGAVWERANFVLGLEGLALAWLRSSQLGLQRRAPLDILKTPVGCNLVLRHLDRIDSGTYM